MVCRLRGFEWTRNFATALVLIVGSQTSVADVVMTDTGAPLKVVVSRDTAIHESANKSSRSRPVLMFEFFYVLKPDTAGQDHIRNGFYRVSAGTSSSYEVGWIHKDDVVEWSHRQALGLRPSGKRDRATFYRSKNRLKDAYRSHGDRLTPFSREPEGSTTDINLLPILSVFPMDVDGDEVSGYRVAYLHSLSGRRARSGRTSGRANSSRVDLDKASLDVVFVIDSTSSMSPHIEATKTAVDRIANEISAQAQSVPVRFGLVAYRDVGDAYVTRMFSNLEQGQDHKRFRRILDELEVEGGGDDAEDMLAGLKLAIQDSAWNPNGFKHMILLADAPAHTEFDGKSNTQRLTLDGVTALAQPTGRENVRSKITIHAVCCHEGTPDAKAAEHLKSIAQGEEFAGFFGEFDTNHSPQFIEDLILRALSSLNAVAGGGDIEEIRQDTPGLGLLFEMVEASEGVRGDIPSFASGYCCEIDGSGNQVFEPYVLVEYGKLGMFNSFIDFSIKSLRQSGDPGSRDVKRVVQSLQIMATHLSLGEQITADTSLAEMANLILGFPVRSKIFDMTFSRLAAMTEADFETWVGHVEASRSVVQSHLDNTAIWKSLGKSVPIEQRYCFLKVMDMP